MRNSTLPIYRIIAETIRERIAAGQYKPGEKIPTIRAFSQEFGRNKITVHRAFALLQQQGVIENRVGSGSYVRFPDKIAASSGGFDFRTDYLDVSLFPYQKIESIIQQLFEHETAGALAPPPVEGDPELIDLLSRRYQLPAERILIISGAQQGLDLVAKVFASDISESILFEDPTYPGVISLFRARHFVPLIDDGPDLALLDRAVSSRIRLFYSMPSVHNPTGITYSPAKKEAVAQRARKHSFFIIEDDYLGELLEPAPRLVDLAPRQTIFIKSLAQTTLAGIRLGFMVVPEDLYPKFVYSKFCSDIASFGLLQKMVREFIRKGYYADHLEKVRVCMDERRRRLLAMMGDYPFLSPGPGRQGYSLWVEDRRLSLPEHPPWSRGEEFSFSPACKSWFRLSFMHLDHAAFESALKFLKNLWDGQ